MCCSNTSCNLSFSGTITSGEPHFLFEDQVDYPTLIWLVTTSEQTNSFLKDISQSTYLPQMLMQTNVPQIPTGLQIYI